MKKPPKARDSVPIWVKEKRRPTRDELAAKHKADGGGMGTSGPAGNSLDWIAVPSESETLTLSSGEVIHVPAPQEAPTIKVKRFNT